jgi:hypothetical protein
MRIRQLFTASVAIMTLLTASGIARAQYGAPYPMAGPSYGGYPGNPSMGPPPGPNMLSHPMVSPFDHMLEQHMSSDGLWFKKASNGFAPFNAPRNYFFNANYVHTLTRDLQGLIGAEGVQTYLQQNDPLNNDIVQDMVYYPYFNAANTGLIPQMKNNGIQLNGGFWNPDGSGLILDLTWNSPSESRFDARHQQSLSRLPLTDVLNLRRTAGTALAAPYTIDGRTDIDIVENDILAPGVPFDTTNTIGYGFFGATFDVLDRTVMNLYGMPVLSGNTPIVVDGETMPYDLDFKLSHSLRTLATSAVYAFSPIIENDVIRVRPVIGGRYFRINETFKFYGRSTLLSYGVDNADADTPVNAKVFPVRDGIDQDNDFIADTPDEPGGSVDTTTTTFTPLEGFSNHLIVESFINSYAVSDLAGPEIGFQYEVVDTGDLTLSGHTRVAAMFNRERLRIRGDNIGNAMGIEVIPDPITGNNISTRMFDTDRTNGDSQNAFADSKSSTHVSPLLEQSLTAQIPLFSQIPVLQDVNILDGARLNVGWSFLLIGEVADPNQSIIYQSSPITGVFPEVSPKRSNFYQNTLSVGLNWEY